MHLSSVLAVSILFVALHHSTAQMNKEAQEQCMAQMMGIHKAETDKDLADKLMKAQVMIKSTVDIVKGLSDAQKDKLRNTYFVGVCAPIKEFYQL